MACRRVGGRRLIRDLRGLVLGLSRRSRTTDVRHDALCERDTTLSTFLSLGCQCGSRAYKRDPLPDDVTPIYTEPKTPSGVIINQDYVEPSRGGLMLNWRPSAGTS